MAVIPVIKGKSSRLLEEMAQVRGTHDWFSVSPSRFAYLVIGFLSLTACAAAAEPTIRVASLRYGTLSWQLDVIAKHGLDKQEGIKVEPLELAATPAAQLALQAGSVDLIVSDWLWVSRQRAEGGDLTFIPFSSAIGALIVPAASPIRDIAGLAGQRLGIAGSALDKSWLVLRLYARKELGVDLDAQVRKSFGAPPLLSEELAAGRLDAVLTYWPFAAKLEARGMRRLCRSARLLPRSGLPATCRSPDMWCRRGGQRRTRPHSTGSLVRAERQMRFLRLPTRSGSGSHR